MSDVTLRDIDIPFTRVVKILFTWMFAWMAVVTVLAIPTIIVYSILMVILIQSIFGNL